MFRRANVRGRCARSRSSLSQAYLPFIDHTGLVWNPARASRQTGGQVVTAITRRWKCLAALALLSGSASLAQQPAAVPARSDTVLLLEIRDAIGPATSDFFVRTLEQASERGA